MKLRKEKYIVVTEKNSHTYFTVKFTYKANNTNRQITKTFSVSDYPTPSACLDAACEWRDLKRAELLLHGLPTGTKRDLDTIIEDHIRINKVTLGNQSQIRSYYKKHIQPYYGKCDICEITALDIQSCLNNMIYDCSDNCINRVATVWKKIIKTARLLGLITINPMEQVVIPKSQLAVDKRNQSVSDEDVKKIIDYFLTTGRNESDSYNNKVIAHFMILMMETGLRPSEVSALQRENIDLTHGVIKVRRSIRSSNTEEYTLGKTKTESSVRDVPMTTNCHLTIASLLEMSRGEQFLFTDYQGNLLTTKKISQHLNTVTKRLGIDFHLYMLRHRFSTKLVTANVDPRTVMELMGHKNFSMTVSYARSDDEKKITAMEENVKGIVYQS